MKQLLFCALLCVGSFSNSSAMQGPGEMKAPNRCAICLDELAPHDILKELQPHNQHVHKACLRTFRSGHPEGDCPLCFHIARKEASSSPQTCKKTHPLIVAARKGDTATVQTLLKQEAYRGKSALDCALIVAVKRGDTATVQTLLKRGANPLALRTTSGKSALDYASNNQEMLQLIDLHLNVPAHEDMTQRKNTSVSATASAAMPIAEACPPETNPLIVAVIKGDTETVQTLLIDEANLFAVGTRGKSALDYALHNAEMLQLIALHLGLSAEALMSQHQNTGVSAASPATRPIEEPYASETNPLIIAVKKGDTVTVQTLLIDGANPLALGTRGKSALDYALHNPEMLQFIATHFGVSAHDLISQHQNTGVSAAAPAARPIAEPYASETNPLIVAVIKGDTVTVQTLLIDEANPFALGTRGKSALDYALHNQEMLQIIATHFGVSTEEFMNQCQQPGVSAASAAAWSIAEPHSFEYEELRQSQER
jgi:ankyrin repeat protein